MINARYDRDNRVYSRDAEVHLTEIDEWGRWQSIWPFIPWFTYFILSILSHEVWLKRRRNLIKISDSLLTLFIIHNKSTVTIKKQFNRSVYSEFLKISNCWSSHTFICLNFAKTYDLIHNKWVSSKLLFLRGVDRRLNTERDFCLGREHRTWM